MEDLLNQLNGEAYNIVKRGVEKINNVPNNLSF